MLTAAAGAFGLVFVAELGDRTQLIALTAATRARIGPLLVAFVGVIAVLQAVAVTAGQAVDRVLPDDATAALSTVLFAGFAVWTWRSAAGTGTGTGTGTGEAPRGTSVTRMALAFAAAEIGDKSMLAAATLAATSHAVGVWIGATAALSAVTATGLLVGRALSRRVPPRALGRAGALAFAVAAAASGAVLVAGVVGG